MTTLVFIGTVTVLMVISVGFPGFNNAPRTVVTSGPVPAVDSIVGSPHINSRSRVLDRQS